MDSRFVSYGEEKENWSGSGFTTPFGYVKETLRWKKKLLFAHGWNNAGRPAIKRCGFSNPSKYHDYRLLFCSYTIRLKAYPKYLNPTRDRPGWERRWYHRTWRYDDNDTSFYRNKDIAGCTDNHIWLSEQPYGRLWVYDSIRIPDFVFLLSVF